MQTAPIQVPLDVALYFVQQLPPTYQEAIFEWLMLAHEQRQNTITENIQVVDNQEDSHQQLPLKRGAGKHLIGFIADDFNEPLEDFKDYM
jgi:hypothetical protein